MEISLNNIPEYLKKSKLFKSFEENSEENDYIIINPKHNKKDINVQSFEYLCIYLDIIRYWMIDNFPKNILYDYVRNNKDIDINYLKNNFPELLDLIDELEYVKNFNEKSFNNAVEKNYLDCLKYLHKSRIWTIALFKICS